MDVATKFFEACDGCKGWEGCKEYVVDETAPFDVQADALEGVTTIQGWCDWMKDFGTKTAPGCSYDLHVSCWDETTKTAIFFATFHGKHTGEGGPVAATNQEMHTEYVYVIKMNDDGTKVANMKKVWNDGFALKQFGWA